MSGSLVQEGRTQMQTSQSNKIYLTKNEEQEQKARLSRLSKILEL